MRKGVREKTLEEEYISTHQSQRNSSSALAISILQDQIDIQRMDSTECQRVGNVTAIGDPAHSTPPLVFSRWSKRARFVLCSLQRTRISDFKRLFVNLN